MISAFDMRLVDKWKLIRLKSSDCHTKDEGIQASVGHVFIDQHFFFRFNAATKKFHKISMLKFRNAYNFVFEFIKSLCGSLWKPLYSYLFPIFKRALKDFLD
jgi:hypothetical protein